MMSANVGCWCTFLFARSTVSAGELLSDSMMAKNDANQRKTNSSMWQTTVAPRAHRRGGSWTAAVGIRRRGSRPM